MDIWWKKDFARVRTNGLLPETKAPYTYQTLETTGDTIGVYIKNADNELTSFKQGALLLRRTITTVGVNANSSASIAAVT